MIYHRKKNMKFQKLELFPTSLVRVDVSDSITNEDHEDMMNYTDELIDRGEVQPCPPAPLYQTNPIVFRDDSDAAFLKLRSTFLDACGVYLSCVPDFTPNQQALEPAGTGAWVYKGWSDLNETQTNPWHHHNPAFLSGVYYLKVPGDHESGGTEFHDPRIAEGHSTRHQAVNPIEKTWLIFPGWLPHKTNYAESNNPRYVVAANLYVRVRY
jgi:hypothetical protein